MKTNEVLEKICSEIEARPRFFNMYIWGYCLAGWAALFTGHQIGVNSWVAWSGPYKDNHVAVVGMHVLGLPNTRLFYLQKWPGDLRARYAVAHHARNGPALAQIIREAWAYFDAPVFPRMPPRLRTRRPPGVL